MLYHVILGNNSTR